MKMKIFALLGFLALFGSRAEAYTLTYDKGFSSATVMGVKCDTSTVKELTQTMSGFNIAAYRVVNTDSADEVYFGYSNRVSSDALHADLGEKVAAGGSAVFEIGRNPDTSAAVKLWCKAADAAGAAGARISLAVFGYK